jgi:hypothetical protein
MVLLTFFAFFLQSFWPPILPSLCSSMCSYHRPFLFQVQTPASFLSLDMLFLRPKLRWPTTCLPDVMTYRHRSEYTVSGGSLESKSPLNICTRLRHAMIENKSLMLSFWDDIPWLSI